MKVALCFAGVVGGSKGKGGVGPSNEVLKIGYDHYQRHILDKNNTDVFVHTWTLECETDIRDLYSPKLIVSEKQIMFDKDPRRGFRKNNHFSRWYSTKRAIELKNEYEKKYNMIYDCVMVTRFDIAWNVDVVFSQFDMNHFHTTVWDKVLDERGKHVPNKEMGWPHDNNGLLDLWFFSKSSVMDEFGKLFDHMKGYSQPGKCPNDSAGWISNHQLALYHLQQMKMKDRIKFVFHYGVGDKEDYSLIRRKYFESKI